MFQFITDNFVVIPFSLISVTVLITCVNRRRRRRQFQESIRDRDALPSLEFAQQYFGESPERCWVATRLYELLADKTFADFSRIRPTDRLEDMELALDSDPCLVWDLERAFEVYLHGGDAENMASFSDSVVNITDLVDAIIQSKHQAWPVPSEA